jgi:hypothetical protein
MMSIRALSLPAALLALTLAACGGGASSSSSTTTTTRSRSAPAGGTKVALRAVLIGQNHNPTVRQPWHYSLRVTDAHGRPVSGTVDVEFALGPLVVGHDTPPVHPLKNGLLRETLTFPAPAVGHPIALRTVVHSKLGSVTRDWPVTVRQ